MEHKAFSPDAEEGADAEVDFSARVPPGEPLGGVSPDSMASSWDPGDLLSPGTQLGSTVGSTMLNDTGPGCIPPGCALGSTFGTTMDSGGSTTLNSTVISSELTPPNTAGQSVDSVPWGMDDWAFIEPYSVRPHTADSRLINELRAAIEGDEELLLMSDVSEIRQKTCALRQKTLELIERESSLGSWDAPQEVHDVRSRELRQISALPYWARAGHLMGQSPHASGSLGDDRVWKELCLKERRNFPPPSPPATAPSQFEAKKAPDPVAPRKKDIAAAKLKWGPRSPPRRVGHGPKGGGLGFNRNQVALLGGVPVTCVDLE